MAWPNPFRYHDKYTRTCWGYTFQVTELHLLPEVANSLKFSYDQLGEQALKKLNAISPPPRSALPRHSGRYTDACTKSEETGPGSDSPKRDLYMLLRSHAADDEVLGTLWAEVNVTPDWVNWEQISRGQEVFYRYGGPALTGLAFQSLLGGMVRT